MNKKNIQTTKNLKDLISNDINAKIRINIKKAEEKVKEERSKEKSDTQDESRAPFEKAPFFLYQ